MWLAVAAAAEAGRPAYLAWNDRSGELVDAAKVRELKDASGDKINLLDM